MTSYFEAQWTEKSPTQYRRNTDVIPTLVFALFLAAPAFAQTVPSGQPVTLQEVLVDEIATDQIWLRFRFVAPQIARKTGSIDFEKAEPDMAHLCQTLALPYMAEYKLEGQMIVISMADRVTEFGVPDPDATQFFEAYRPVDNSCIWEGL